MRHSYDQEQGCYVVRVCLMDWKHGVPMKWRLQRPEYTRPNVSFYCLHGVKSATDLCGRIRYNKLTGTMN
jgi:hypothetical protein